MNHILSGYKQTSYEELDFQVPEYWEEQSESNGMKAFFSGDGGLVISSVDLKDVVQEPMTEEEEKLILEMMSEAILKNFSITSTEYISILDNTITLKLVGSTDTDSGKAPMQAYYFLPSDKLYSFMFVSSSEFDPVIISNIINSIN